MNNIKEISSDQFKIMLDKLSSEFLNHKFKLAENHKAKYDAYIAKLQAECEHLKKNEQACENEQDFLDNTKKIVDVLEKSSEPVGKAELAAVIQSIDTYLYAVLLNLEKIGVVEKV